MVKIFLSTNSKLLFALVMLACHQISLAQDDFFGAIDLGFESNSANEAYSVIGWLTQKLTQGIENPGPLFSRTDNELSKVETSLFAQFDTQFDSNFAFRFSAKAYHDEIYRLNNDTEYSASERNAFRNRFEVRDFYLEKKFDNGFYLKVGNQILAWGLAEFSRVTDLINTEDQFTLGQQDLEDIRLQVPAALLSYATGDWTFDGVITHRAGRNNIAPAGDEFDQFIRLRQSATDIDCIDADNDQEYFFRASTHLSQGDFAVVAAEYNDNTLSLQQFTGAIPRSRYGQNRMRAFSVSANWADGSWLYFGEIGLHFDKAVIPNLDAVFQQAGAWDKKDQILSVFGIEYNGFKNLLLTFELDSVRSKNHDRFMYADRDQTSFGARLYWTALNEKLKISAVHNKLPSEPGQVSRVSIDYNWSDNLELGLLWVDYSADQKSIYYEFRNNDIVQLQLRYNFQI